MKKRTGFTLLELLIVMGILMILGGITVITFDPEEQLKKARDARRLADLHVLYPAIDFYIQETPGAIAGPPGQCENESSPRLFVSVPSDSGESSPANLPSGWTYGRAPASSAKRTDGTGWLPLNLATTSGGSTITTLPLDPINRFDRNLYYGYSCRAAGLAYTITAFMESKRYSYGGDQDKTSTDGGADSFMYEIGPNLFLSPLRPAGSWSFEEGSGITTADSSGNNNTGTLTNGPIWATGKIGKAVSFDGTDDYIVTTQNIGITGSSTRTLTFWAKVITNPADRSVIGWGSSGTYLSYVATLYNAGVPGPWMFWGQAYDMSTEVMPALGIWQHHAVTFNGTAVRWYINGSQVANADMPLLNTVASPLYIGRFVPGWMGYSNVAIDEARVYNRALSADEIRSTYNATK